MQPWHQWAGSTLVRREWFARGRRGAFAGRGARPRRITAEDRADVEKLLEWVDSKAKGKG